MRATFMRALPAVAASIAFGVSGLLAQQNARTPWTGPPNYLRELRYDGQPGSRMANRVQYYVKMAEADEKGNSGRMRWFDRAVGRPLMIAFIPAYALGEFDKRPGSGPLFTAAFSAEQWQQTLQAAGQDGPETEVLRKFRNDLSMNRDRHLPSRRGMTMYTEVWVEPGMSVQFEQAVRRAVEAYKKVSPDLIISAAETVYGQEGGPDYIFMTPYGEYAGLEKYLDMPGAVAEAFGAADAQSWGRLFAEAVIKVDRIMLRRAAPDTFVP